MSKRYQTNKKEGRSFAVMTSGILGMVLLMLIPVFQAWGISWWIDTIAIVLVVGILGTFTLCASLFLGQWTLKLECESDGLRLRNWRGARFLRWSEVTAWCAVEIDEGARLICLKSPSSVEPFAIDPDLLHGKQFAKIYRDIEEHCGPPSPGADVLGDNHGEPFTDKPA